MPPAPILFCWSGGKDSAMALHALLQRSDERVASLLTTVTEGYDRISMHGVRRELLLRQAQSLGLPLHEVRIPPQCSNAIYEARMQEALLIHYSAGIRAVAFGDIFLEDLRQYREQNLARLGMTALFPIWKRDTRELIRHFHAAHFRAIAVCVDPKVLDRSFAGRELDESFFHDLPPSVDPCGENGEFHTFVFDGPIFANPIPVRPGEVLARDSFIYRDLLPAPVVPLCLCSGEFISPAFDPPSPKEKKMNAQNAEHPQKEALLLRTILILTMISLAAVLRILPHPWNFTPVGAIALFSGAMVRSRRLAFVFPILAMLAADLFLGFNKLSPLVYASFALSVLIGRLLTRNRDIPRVAGATFLGALQFFLITNFGVWAFLGSYPRTLAGLLACYVSGVPFFWNTLAGDACYTALLFGGFALAEHLIPGLRQPAATGH
jgi:uncharacterized protein (TIGR00290 family)